MNSRFFGILGALAAATFVACTEDPLESLRGGPDTIAINPNPLVVTVGGSATIEVEVRDEQLNGLAVPVSVSAGTADITVTPSTAPPDPTGIRRFYRVTAVSPAATAVNASAGGVSGQGIVAVLPLTFGGAPGTTSPQVGQPLTYGTAAPIEFDATTEVFFDGYPLYIAAQTPTSLTVIPAFVSGTTPFAPTFENLAVTGVPGLLVGLEGATALNPPTGSVHDPNDFPNPAATITIPDSLGAPTVLYEGYPAGTVCDDGVGAGCDNFYTFVLTDTTTFTVTLEWVTAADVDILFCDDGCNNFVGSFGGATGDNPEEVQVTLLPGTYNLWINLFLDEGEPALSYRITITNP